MPSVDRRTLREHCLDTLRSAITCGDLPFGTRLVETELSQSLQVSRGTLREALRVLEQEGLVTTTDGGMRVRRVGRQELLDIYTVRATLEALAVAELCGRDDLTELLPRLRDALEDMDNGTDLAEHAEADLRFHRLLCELTGNQPLARSWNHLSGYIRMTMMRAGPELARHLMSVERHRPIYDAVVEGDAESAVTIVHEHMREAVGRLTSEMQD